MVQKLKVVFSARSAYSIYKEIWSDYQRGKLQNLD